MSRTLADVLIVLACAGLLTGYCLLDEWRRNR